MSFSAETKNELCRLEGEDASRDKAECYGIFLFAKSFMPENICMTTENGLAAHRAAELAARTAGVVTEITSVLTRRRGANTYTLSVQGEDQRRRFLAFFGHTGRELNLRINRENLGDPPSLAPFLRGVFLSCGTVTDPQKDYHLEMIVPYMKLARDLITLLEEAGELSVQPSLVNRKGSFVVYVKGSEQIADFLTYIGAKNSSMELMQVKMLKQMRNDINRKTNFETANLGKTADAAARQIAAIEAIDKKVGLHSLPEDLRELASLRRENPEMSLRELGAGLSEPISRSGVNHRLQRILEFAQALGVPGQEG